MIKHHCHNSSTASLVYWGLVSDPVVNILEYFTNQDVLETETKDCTSVKATFVHLALKNNVGVFNVKTTIRFLGYGHWAEVFNPPDEHSSEVIADSVSKLIIVWFSWSSWITGTSNSQQDDDVMWNHFDSNLYSLFTGKHIFHNLAWNSERGLWSSDLDLQFNPMSDNIIWCFKLEFKHKTCKHEYQHLHIRRGETEHYCKCNCSFINENNLVKH